jgi:shikimate dehydrogenase
MSSPARPISATTALVGVLGDPVRHSLSPAMHNAALAALGLDWAYLALPVAAADLATVLAGLRAIDCRGLNVTLPHKQEAAKLATRLTPLAARLGAVNTLVPLAEGGWLGTNTDVEGFLAPLRQGPAGETKGSDSPWQGRQALVLGCGGSARAVVAALADLGLERILVAGRHPDSLTSFVASCHSWVPGLAALPWPKGRGSEDQDLGALPGALASSDLIVNTTPVGMATNRDPEAAERCPLDSAQLENLRPGSTVYDLIYVPRPSTLLKAARERGCLVIDGLEMLVNQGAASLRLWSGLADVPVAAMREAALLRLEGA